MRKVNQINSTLEDNVTIPLNKTELQSNKVISNNWNKQIIDIPILTNQVLQLPNWVISGSMEFEKVPQSFVESSFPVLKVTYTNVASLNSLTDFPSTEVAPWASPFLFRYKWIKKLDNYVYMYYIRLNSTDNSLFYVTLNLKYLNQNVWHNINT